MKPYYQDSACTIYHGDNRRIVPLLDRFDLLLTDPPFGIGMAAQPTNYQRYAGKKAKSWDDSPACEWLLNCARDLCGRQIVWGGNYFTLPISRCWLVWHKPDGPPSFSRCELAWTNLDEVSKHFTFTISETNGERVGHPTQKPLKLITWCLSHVPDCETVLDPWAGSGTTGVACKELGRRCILIEQDEEYCEIAAKRLSQEVLAL